MALNIGSLLDTYPRTRPPLPAEWEPLYEGIYQQSRGGRTLLYRITQALEAWMHNAVAARRAGVRTLELGAGTLNHVRYEHAPACYDVVEPFRALYESAEQRSRIRNFYSDIASVPPGVCYDHIVSVATLEHVTDLPRTVARCGLLLARGGEFRAGIPSEGGMLWGLAWRASVGLACRLKHGLDYGALMRHEHVSNAGEIVEVVRYFFARCEWRRFPTPLHHLSLYAALKASEPRLDRCHAALKSAAT